MTRNRKEFREIVAKKFECRVSATVLTDIMAFAEEVYEEGYKIGKDNMCDHIIVMANKCKALKKDEAHRV